MKLSKKVKHMIAVFGLLLLISCFSTAAFADTTNTDVAGGVVKAFNSYFKPQAKTIINAVVLPFLDLGCLGYFLYKIGNVAISYHRQQGGGQIEWGGVIAPLCGLVFLLSASFWAWGIIGW